MTDNIKRLLIIPFVIYIVIFIMNVMGLPRGVCDAGNHVFVAVCFVFCAMAWKRTKDSLLLIFMALTLAADILSGFPKVFAVGVVFFFASQIVLSMIIWRQNGGRPVQMDWRSCATCANGSGLPAQKGFIRPAGALNRMK